MNDTIRTLLAGIVLHAASQAVHAGSLEFEYDETSDRIRIDVVDTALGDALKELSYELGFDVHYEGVDLQRPVTLSFESDSRTVLTHLIKPDSAIVSQSDQPPHPVTRLIILPVGNESSTYLPQKSLSPPMPTGDPHKDEKHMRRYLKKLNKLQYGPEKPRRGKMTRATPMKRSINEDSP